MPEITRIAHANPATVRAMIARMKSASALGQSSEAATVAANLHCAIDVALEPLGLTLAEVKVLEL